MRRTKTKSNSPKFHLDKRAAQLAATTIIQPVQASDDELLTTKQTAAWLGVSEQWLGNRRANGDGPPFERMSDRVIRYRRGTVRGWLDQRSHLAIAEYKSR